MGTLRGTLGVAGPCHGALGTSSTAKDLSQGHHCHQSPVTGPRPPSLFPLWHCPCSVPAVPPSISVPMGTLSPRATIAVPAWYPARQSLRLDPIAARGHHGHALLPGPGGADQLGDGVPDGVRRPSPHLPAVLFPGAVPVRAPL
uniref:Uncharacterized protein n=1 Tax=Ficedula albicollis TaxID=59894 RepID=A0A803WD93_FICAL